MSIAKAATGVSVDAFTAEVVRSTVVAITDEMKTNLMRTAYNMIIYEAEDFTVGLFDADGNTISIGLGLPMFIRGLSDAIKAKLRHWGKDNIEPGDILLTNDPQVMGSHLNHMIFTLPVFHDGELIAFSSSMGHWQDVGGVLGAVTRDVFSEGLQMPFVKIFKRGEQDQEITSIIRSNCRLPEFAMGDFRAQIASIRTGERRLTNLLRRYGSEIFMESVKLIFDQSERLALRDVERDVADRMHGAHPEERGTHVEGDAGMVDPEQRALVGSPGGHPTVSSASPTSTAPSTTSSTAARSARSQQRARWPGVVSASGGGETGQGAKASGHGVESLDSAPLHRHRDRIGRIRGLEEAVDDELLPFDAECGELATRALGFAERC